MKRFCPFIAALLMVSTVVKSQPDLEKITSPVIDGKPIPAEVIMASHDFRDRLLSDPYRPAFHFCFPEDNGRPGDPNGAFYHNGLYHLMFLYEREGFGFSWGHASSGDLVHWRFYPDAIVPGNGDDGCFSGGAFVDDDGTAVLSYWMLWGAKGIGLAKSTDPDFKTWKKSGQNPVISSSEWGITEMKDASGKIYYVGSADPSNIWKKDGHYYMATGNLLVLRKFGSRGTGLPANFDNGPALPPDSVAYQGDRLYLFKSDDLKTWKYLHELYKSDRKWTNKNEDNMCPSFLPLPSGPDGGSYSGKHLLLFISHNRGCQYYTGTYKDDRFFPENHGRMSWNDNAYFAPEALVDDRGRQIMWSWVFDDRPDSVINYYGWTGMYGLPRTLWIRDDGTLGMKPVKELESLRTKEVILSGLKITPGRGTKLDIPDRELQELEISFIPGRASRYGVKICVSDDGLEETSIYYDSIERKLRFDTRKSGLSFGRKIVEEAPLELSQGEPLVLRIYIDRGIAEVFANDRQAVARTIYPTLGGHGIILFSEGGDAEASSIKSWELIPSNPY